MLISVLCGDSRPFGSLPSKPVWTLEVKALLGLIRGHSTLYSWYHFKQNKSDYRVYWTNITVLFSYFRYHCPMPKISYVQLTVGNNEFFGEGKTRQAARHNAAMKALQALQNEPIPEKSSQVWSCCMWQSLSIGPCETIEKTNACIFTKRRNTLSW